MTENQSTEQYTVVARRYRPQTFNDLVGQNHISKALGNAIKQNRVGHAYLFTGARGVGKTSSARIFAKCLNCETGPTEHPCNQCDICEAVSVGEDVDVLEIDGASNRGIDEIRQLRGNVSVRPSRSRFKIYIIDEVHMLTPQAFNALLKTLEEPPDHVKFIFCTTDPQKIPITVLSRCQRFDFSPVQTDEITGRLREIAEQEGVQAEEQALALLARRAGGSMRDSQSLLEQLFSFCAERITVNDVHQLLGTADVSRIADLADAMSRHDASDAINQISDAVSEGVDAGQFTKQTLSYFRDMMALRVGCGIEAMLTCGEGDLERLRSQADAFGLETILNVIQILDTTVVRMQSSMHARTLLEVGAVRVCNLESLDSLPDLVAALTSGKSVPGHRPAPAATTKSGSKKNDISPPAAGETKPSETPANATSATVTDTSLAAQDKGPVDRGQSSAKPAPVETGTTPAGVVSASATPESDSSKAIRQEKSQASDGDALTDSNVRQIWERALQEINDMTSEIASTYESLKLKDPSHLVVTLPDKYNSDLCNRVERRKKLETALASVSGTNIRVDFVASPSAERRAKPAAPKMTRAQQILKLRENPIVQSAMQVFDADIVDFRKSTGKK